MTSSTWLLGISNTFHLFATIGWVGWSILLGLYVAPRPMRAFAHDTGPVDPLAHALLNRLSRLAYLAIAVLIATGLLQMSMNPNYEGFLRIRNAWAILIAAKHGVVGVSVVVVFYLNMDVVPELRYQQERASRLGEKPDTCVPEQHFRWLARLNLALALLILLLTGLATAMTGPAALVAPALLGG